MRPQPKPEQQQPPNQQSAGAVVLPPPAEKVQPPTTNGPTPMAVDRASAQGTSVIRLPEPSKQKHPTSLTNSAMRIGATMPAPPPGFQPPLGLQAANPRTPAVSAALRIGATMMTPPPGVNFVKPVGTSSSHQATTLDRTQQKQQQQVPPSVDVRLPPSSALAQQASRPEPDAAGKAKEPTKDVAPPLDVVRGGGRSITAAPLAPAAQAQSVQGSPPEAGSRPQLIDLSSPSPAGKTASTQQQVQQSVPDDPAALAPRPVGSQRPSGAASDARCTSKLSGTAAVGLQILLAVKRGLERTGTELEPMHLNKKHRVG